MTSFGVDAAMRRGFELAALGPARGVNPQVGCVLLSPSGELLAEGYHRGAGTPHAEVDALSKLAPGEARGATAVVTLEPCNHTGRTGPCAQALIEAGVAKVIFSVPDPGVASSGGAATLRAAGIEVTSDLLRSEGEALLGNWLRAARLGRPWVIVKWAQSLDGRAAANDGSSQWISSAEARADVHRERSLADAIAVGTGTVLADDPALSARTANGLYAEQPIPVIFGRTATPAKAKLRAGTHEPIFLDGRDLAANLAELSDRGIHSLFVEGGPKLASSFLKAGLADELLVYLAPILLGGTRTALADVGVDTLKDATHWRFVEQLALGPDLKLRAWRE